MLVRVWAVTHSFTTNRVTINTFPTRIVRDHAAYALYKMTFYITQHYQLATD